MNSRLPSLLCSYPNMLKLHFNPPRIAGLEARARKPTRWALLNASRLSFLPQTFLFHLIHKPACSLLREALNGSQCNLGFSWFTRETLICVHLNLILEFGSLLGEVMLVEIWGHYIKNFSVVCFSFNNSLEALKKLAIRLMIFITWESNITQE